MQQLAVNDQALRRAWESSQRSTKEDWAEWMRHFAVELLKESPSHALRATHLLAQVWLCNYTVTGRKLAAHDNASKTLCDLQGSITERSNNSC